MVARHRMIIVPERAQPQPRKIRPGAVRPDAMGSMFRGAAALRDPRILPVRRTPTLFAAR